MPSRNVVKNYAPESYYHIYARGINKQPIFLDQRDFDYFINLFSRYLSIVPAHSREGFAYPHFKSKVQLLSFCLMPNHFHLLVYQEEDGAMPRLMQSIMTSYSRYFNLRYKRRGPLYESRYKASMITTDSYLHHISRYIHLNPRYWKRYNYSSLQYFKADSFPEWLDAEKIKSLFVTVHEHMNFVSDYADYRQTLAQIKDELADR